MHEQCSKKNTSVTLNTQYNNTTQINITTIINCHLIGLGILYDTPKLLFVRIYSQLKLQSSPSLRSNTNLNLK